MSKRQRMNHKIFRVMENMENIRGHQLRFLKALDRQDRKAKSDRHMAFNWLNEFRGLKRTPAPFHNGRKR